MGVNWADLMAAQGAFGTDFYDRSILRLLPTYLIYDYTKKNCFHGTSPPRRYL